MTTVDILKSEKVLKTISIDQDVYRIGNDEQASVRLPSGESHALTVISRDGRTRIINRLNRPIFIDGNELGPVMSRAWLPGQIIAIDEVTSVRLHGATKNLGRNARRQEDSKKRVSAADSSSQNEKDANRDFKSKRNTVILAGLTALMMAGILCMPGDTSHIDSQASFCSVCENLSRTGDLRLQHLKAMIQEGRAYELRGMTREAVLAYSKARDTLRTERGHIGSDTGAGTVKIIRQSLAFVETACIRLNS